MQEAADPRAQADQALDAANFFLADVRDGLGPDLAVYLLTEQRWRRGDVMVCVALVVTFASLLLPPGVVGHAAFLTLGAIAAIGFIVFLLAFPGASSEAAARTRTSPRVAAE